MIRNAFWPMLGSALATAALAVLVTPALRRADAAQLRRRRAHPHATAASAAPAQPSAAPAGAPAPAGNGGEAQPLRH